MCGATAGVTAAGAGLIVLTPLFDAAEQLVLFAFELTHL
jgi:hypothetical protein